MKNVCPHCGRNINEGEQAFDLTVFLGQMVKRLLQSRLFNEDENNDEKERIGSGMEAFFNTMKQNDPLVFTEKALWELPSIKSDSPTTAKTVLFQFPYTTIKEKMKLHLQGGDEPLKTSAFEWYNGHESLLKKMVFRMSLRKMAEGDIRFDTILDNFDSRPITRTRVCPHEGCHGKLSFWAGRYREICMSVLGGERVSKTTTLTAMAYAYIQGYQGIRLEGSSEDEAFDDFESNCLSYYSDGQPLKATELVKKNTSRLSFRVTLGKNGYITLTFVDLPGELNNEEGISDEMFARYGYYFDNVDFIWYCTDPGELVGLQETAQKGNHADELGLEEGKAPLRTARICANMEQLGGFFRDAGKVIPVAYILGKTDSDLIDPTDKENFHLHEEPHWAARRPPCDLVPLDLEQFYRESAMTKEYMKRRNPKLVDTFEKNFLSRGYFAMSAYGWNPKNNKEKRSPDPYKTTVPLIWMLACKGYIPIKARKEKRRFGQYSIDVSNIYLSNCDPNTKEDILYNLLMKGNYRLLQ